MCLDRANSGFDYFTLLDAGSYLSASEKFGSPAYDQAELAAAPESGRAAADKVLGAALGLRLDRASLTPAQAALCRPLDGGAPVTLPADGTILRNRGPGPVAIDLRRYATARRRSSSASSPPARPRRWPFRPTARRCPGSSRCPPTPGSTSAARPRRVSSSSSGRT